MTDAQNEPTGPEDDTASAFESLSATGPKTKYIKATADGLLIVKGSFPGDKTELSLPSGLRVVLKETKGGRDYGTIDEGVLVGEDFNVLTGYLVDTYPRVSDLKVKARPRTGGPSPGPGEIALEVTVSWVEGTAAKKIGPINAITSATDPMEAGKNRIRIADFGHKDGAAYPPYGMVWFRVATTKVGEYYIHGGNATDGCLTMDPQRWTDVYTVLHKARAPGDQYAGDLDMSYSDIDLIS